MVMENTTNTKKAVKKTRKTIKTGSFYSLPVRIGKRGITMTLPLEVANYFNLETPEIYWTPINGIIQLSASQPQLIIPIMSNENNSFVPHNPR